MARVGEEFPLECPNYGGDIRLIAFSRSMTIATSFKRRIDELPVIDIHSL